MRRQKYLVPDFWENHRPCVNFVFLCCNVKEAFTLKLFNRNVTVSIFISVTPPQVPKFKIGKSVSDVPSKCLSLFVFCCLKNVFNWTREYKGFIKGKNFAHAAFALNLHSKVYLKLKGVELAKGRKIFINK